ncbi:MAG TPA: hypothetical protein VK977_08095, partial [Actinomycetota bacterium]|nr:hypothetical protein [Actinomycetota bacterium]
MHLRRPVLALAAFFGLLLPVSSAGASPEPPRDTEDSAVDSPVEAAEALDEHQHGGVGGHLPASSANVELVGKLKLTNVAGGISDVGAFGNYAYLGAFNPECAGRPGAQGTGVHIVDIANPAAPTKVGFISAHPNSYVGEGVHVIHMSTPFYTGDLLVHNNEACDSSLAFEGGVSLWNVTNPLAPVKFAGGVGDSTPA